MTFENLVSILGFLVAGAAMAELLLLHHLFAKNALLLAVQGAAVLLMIWARMTFGLRSLHAAASTTEGALVTNGPYRFWRHPIYASVIYFVWAGQVEAPAAVPVALAAAVTLGLFTRMLIEEQFLMQTYAGYADYARKARRLIPFVW